MIKSFDRKAFNRTKKKTVKAEDCKFKRQINEYLSKNGNRNCLAVALDGPEGKTLHALKKNGWVPAQILLPNANRKDYLSLKRMHKNTTHQTLGTLLPTIKQKIGMIYMDYMCSWGGNKSLNTSPKDDINTLFTKRQLSHNAILGITISFRTKKKAAYKYQAIHLCKRYIGNAAKRNGYRAIFVEDVGGVYRNLGPMFTGIFKIKKGKL
jgi:hypothetical protein